MTPTDPGTRLVDGRASAADVRLEAVDAVLLERLGATLELDADADADADAGRERASACLVRWPRPITVGATARWAWLPLAGEAAAGLAWIEVAAAPLLEAVPRELSVVYVVDASRSEGAEGVRAQLTVVRAAASHLPHAQHAVVAFSRRARLVTPGFVSTEHLGRALAAGAWATTAENGSDVTQGLRAAAALLAGRRGATRIVLMTDREQPFDASPGAALAAVAGAPPGTVVHVVERASTSGAVAVVRLDLDPAAPPPEEVTDADFGPLVRATGGMLVRIVGGDEPETLAALRLAARDLVIPGRIHDLRVVFTLDVDGWTTAGAQLSASARRLESGFGDGTDSPYGADGSIDVPAGRTGRAVTRLGSTPRGVVLSGRIWGRHVQLAARFDPQLRRAMPALVVGRGQLDGLADLDPIELPDAMLLALGRTHHLVTRLTSFLVAPRDAAPSADGTDEGRGMYLRGVHVSTCSHCRPGVRTMGHLGVRPRQSPEALLTAELAAPIAACVARHGATPAEAQLQIETTAQEILGVVVDGAPAAVAGCLREAVWAARAPWSMGAHDVVTLDVGEILAHAARGARRDQYTGTVNGLQPRLLPNSITRRTASSVARRS